MTGKKRRKLAVRHRGGGEHDGMGGCRVNPLGNSGVEAVCDSTDGDHLDTYSTASESKKLRVKLDSDTQN